MTDSQDKTNDIFDEMVEKGMLSMSNHWIQRAIEGKNPRLTMDLAYSRLLIYDIADKMLLSMTDLN